MSLIRHFALALTIALVSSTTAFGQALTITDVFDREVTFDKPIERVILGDGRFLYALAPLQKDDPFDKIVAWSDKLITSSPTLWGQFAEAFPAARDLPIIGAVADGEVATEHLLAFNADVLVLPLDAEHQAAEANVITTLGQIGVEVVFIDLQEYPLENTDRSIRILGQIFGKDDAAEAFVAWRQQQFVRVTDVIAAHDPERPVVFLDRFPGPPDPCCKSYGPANFGKLIEIAGGDNLASKFMSVSRVTLNPEQILASKPEIYIATGSDLKTERAIVRLHAGADRAAAIEALKGTTSGPAFVGSPALESQRVHGIWHLFEANSYDVIALQAVAKWIHPELFTDLDPEATFKELHDLYLPFDYQPGYWVSLTDDLG